MCWFIIQWARFVVLLERLWGDLAPGYRISQALNFTCGVPGRLRGRNPCLKYRWTCDPTIWWGFCPDISLP